MDLDPSIRKKIDREEISVGLKIMVTNSHNEVLLLRATDESGVLKEKWMCLECPLPKGADIESCIKREVKQDIYMEVDLIESVEPYEVIKKEDGKTIEHHLVMGFKALSHGDISELGPNIKTAGWFTRQEISWYWDKIHKDTKRILVALQFVSETGEF